MSSDRNKFEPDQGLSREFETEYVVEYVDNKRPRSVLVAIIIVLLLLLLGLTWVIVSTFRPLGRPDAAGLPDGITWVRSIYAWGDNADQLLEAPVDVAIANDGTIWTSTNGNMLVAYSPEGQVRRVIAPEIGAESGQAVSYEGIAVDDAGNVYACDYGRNAIVVYSPEGQVINEWGVQLPLEIAVRDGRVAVAGSGGVALFDDDGDLITQWGQRGRAEGDFDLPHGIAIGEDGTVYVSDTQNVRVKAYSPDGRLLWTKSSPTAEGLEPSAVETETVDGIAQNIQLPLGMTFDGAGRLVVADAFEFQLIVLDVEQEGLVTARYGEDGAADGKFGYPTGVSYDSNRDWFAVADTANDRLQIIRIPGSGGSLLATVLSRSADRALWLCSIPLLVLLIVLILAIRRRRERQGSEESVKLDAVSAD